MLNESHREYFLKFCELHLAIDKKADLIAKGGLDIVNFTDDYFRLAICALKMALTKEQLENFEWWLYEYVEKVIWHAKPVKKKFIVETPEQIFDYLIKHCD